MASHGGLRPGGRLVLLALATMLVVSSTQVQAQGWPGPGGGGGGMWGGGGHRGPGGMGGRRMGGPPRDRARMPSPEQLEGPPAPAELRQIAELNDNETSRYDERYTKYMADTKPLRDSLRTTMAAMRKAFDDGDRETAQEHRPAAERQWKTLSAADEKFAKGLKDVLTKDELKRYKQWQKDRDEDAARRRFDRRPPDDDRGRDAP